MKAICMLIAVLLSLQGAILTLAPQAAYAQEEYLCLRVLTDDVAFYSSPSDKEENILFYLIKSYYLLGERYDDTFYSVTYQDKSTGYVKLNGYVKVTDVCESATEQPLYPSIAITPLGKNVLISEEPYTLSTHVLAVYQGDVMYAYGKYPTENGIYWYVCKRNNLGYVKQDEIVLPEIPLHPDPLPSDSPPDDSTPPTDSGGEIADALPALDTKMQVALVIAILIPTMFLVWMLFKPQKKGEDRQQHSRYYQ